MTLAHQLRGSPIGPCSGDTTAVITMHRRVRRVAVGRLVDPPDPEEVLGELCRSPLEIHDAVRGGGHAVDGVLGRATVISEVRDGRDHFGGDGHAGGGKEGRRDRGDVNKKIQK